MSPKKVKIILDSSILFVPFQFSVDIFEELGKILNRRFEPILLSPTYEELQTMAQSSATKLGRQAVLALKLAQKCIRVNAVKTEKESHDDVIVRVASEAEYYVATNDRALRKKLRRLNVPVIYLRQKSHLALEGAL